MNRSVTVVIFVSRFCILNGIIAHEDLVNFICILKSLGASVLLLKQTLVEVAKIHMDSFSNPIDSFKRLLHTERGYHQKED